MRRARWRKSTERDEVASFGEITLSLPRKDSKSSVGFCYLLLWSDGFLLVFSFCFFLPFSF